MRDAWDVCAIGGGPDALVAAAYLARSGRSVLVVGEPGTPGGIAANVEIVPEITPGFVLPVAPETLPGPDPAVMADLGLERHGLKLTAPDPVVTVVGEGEPFLLPRDPAKAALALPAPDAARYPGFVAELRALAGFLRRLLDRPPLSLDSGLPDVLPAAFAALGLGGRRVNELFRTLPMALKHHLDNWFESRPLQAALAGSVLTGIRLGPRAAGTAGLFLHFHAFGRPEPLGWIRPAVGGPAAVGQALRAAARAAGAHGTAGSGGVRRIVIADKGVSAVELVDGRRIACRTIVSDAAPETTLRRWVGERNLSPDFAHEVRHIRYRGTAARVGFALSALPRFPDSEGEPDPRLGGVIQIGASLDALERAADAFKYNELPANPAVYASFPSVHGNGMAPAGAAVLAATVQSVPADADEDQVAKKTLGALESVFPGIRELVTGCRVLTPRMLERGFGLVEGSYHQGEPAMDQLYSLRPVPGFSRHRTPFSGLYLAGPGTCPYGGLHGVSGRNAAQAVEEDAR